MKEFIDPEIEISTFDVEDIISTSFDDELEWG